MKNIRFVLLLTFLSVSPVLFSQTSSISVKSLPKEALDFIDKYFSEYYLYRGMEQSSMYTAIFREGLKINFTLKGEWISVNGSGKPIPMGYVDEKIIAAIKEKYPDMDITYINKGSKKYDIKLKNRVNLVVDYDGNILKSDRDY